MGLFLYKILFMTELLIAVVLFSFRLNKRSYFVLRLIAGIAFSYAVAFLFPILSFSFSGWYSSIMFLCLFVTALLMMKFVFKVTWINALFCTITAYTVQHLAYEFFTLLSVSVGLGDGGMYSDTVVDLAALTIRDIFVALIYLGVYLLTYWSSYLIMGRKLVKDGNIYLKNLHLLGYAGLILLVDIILNAFVVYIGDGYNKIYTAFIAIYNILCCILVFYIQFSIVNVKQMRQEIETVSHLLFQATQQYEVSKENINLISLKCHDLKHQVAQFAHKGKMDKESIDEINELISIYDSSVETGNEALDVILTEKSLMCQSRGIKLTCMADGGAMGFIKENDLYVLFGNALSNSIEAVMLFTDESKRCIGLNVHKTGSLISININNYYGGDLIKNIEGLPETTKQDKNYHGFGLKSMKMIVEKYKGDLSIVCSDDIFNLNIIFPIPLK